VEQRHFSTFCTVSANDFVKFWLFSVEVYSSLLRSIWGLHLQVLMSQKCPLGEILTE